MRNHLRKSVRRRRFLPGCIAAVVLAGMVFLWNGCGIEKTDGSKVRDLEYEIVEEENLPEELAAKIEEKKAADFKLTYEGDKDLYIVRGYGEQETGGYSIQILDFYLTQNAVVFDTNLVGPSKDEVKNAAPSFPYLVVKTKNPDKNVIFQ
ncbi:MAG: protease complex subunit PrcB family protein [Eubacterium sp.]|nr:protease complex subunit PrcB family protein [Eubacterium sp.]